jgi:hypothetical protein
MLIITRFQLCPTWVTKLTYLYIILLYLSGRYIPIEMLERIGLRPYKAARQPSF